MAAHLPGALIDRAETLLASGGRILGIAGPPGAGKSTLSEALATHFRDRAQLLPMDGFHLANEELIRLGRNTRKGAPDTFDVDGYLSALQRVRAREHDVLVPRFHRQIEEPVAGAIRIAVDVDLVITDGNYLLLQQDRWSEVAQHLDESWMLRPNDAVRHERLVARHVVHGRTVEQAEAWVHTVDEPNAVLIGQLSAAADLVITTDNFSYGA